MPDKTGGKQLASKYGGAAGYGIAAGVMHMFQQKKQSNAQTITQSSSSTVEDVGEDDDGTTQEIIDIDMDNSTYRRLHIGILGFCTLGLFTIPGEAGFFYTAFPSFITYIIMTITRLVGGYVSYTGYKKSNSSSSAAATAVEVSESTDTSLSSSSVITKFSNFIGNTLRGLKVQNKKRALTYRNIVLIMMFNTFSKLMDIRFYARVRNKSSFALLLFIFVSSR